MQLHQTMQHVDQCWLGSLPVGDHIHGFLSQALFNKEGLSFSSRAAPEGFDRAVRAGRFSLHAQALAAS